MEQLTFGIVSGPTWADMEASLTLAFPINIFVQEKDGLATPYLTFVVSMRLPASNRMYFEGATRHPVHGLVWVEAILATTMPHRGAISVFVHEAETNG